MIRASKKRWLHWSVRHRQCGALTDDTYTVTDKPDSWVDAVTKKELPEDTGFFGRLR